MVEKGKGKKMPKDNKQRRRNVRLNKGITREEFHSLVKKAAQPVEKPSESDSTSGET
jgi:hypothetical protein